MGVSPKATELLMVELGVGPSGSQIKWPLMAVI